MRIPHVAVRRPVTVLMGVLIVALLGFVSLTRLPIDLFPDIEVPILAIITNYEGAGPYEVESMVSRPLEEALGAVNGVTNISSISRKGSSIVVVEFDWGTNMDLASLDVREKVDRVKDYLPDEADSPMVVKYDPQSMPIMQLALIGDKQPHELRRLAEDVVKNRLERLDGVASVNISGGQEREIQVFLHPGMLQAYGISVDTVVKSIQAANLNLPAGQITEQGLEYVLRTTGEFETVSEIADVRIPTSTGSTVSLSDIGEVVDGFKETTELSRYNGEPSVALSIQKEASSNIVQVAERVRREIESIQESLGDSELVVVQDMSTFIRRSINNVTSNALLGAALAVLVLFVFLRSVRTTLIIAVAIPVSVIATFTLIYFSHTTINMMSLGGLALGTGMLVDSAIVVLESIFRHWESGKKRDDAAAEGAEEVGTAITASTLTTVSVFLPVVFVSGISGEIFQDLALTVTFSLLASLVVALTLIPSLAARLLSQSGNADQKRRGLVQKFMEALQGWYFDIIHWALHHRASVLVIAGVVLVVSLALVPKVGMEFMPQMDEGSISVSISMPKGTKLEETNRIAGLIEEYCSKMPEAETVYVSVGSGSSGIRLGDGSEEEKATVGLELVPAAQRQRSTFDLVNQLREYVAGIPGAEISVKAQSSYMASFGDPIQIELKGDDLELLEEAAARLKPIVAQVPGAKEVTTSLEQTRPEFQLQINREKAASYGLSIAQIASTVRTAVSGQVATQYRTGGKEIDVVVRFPERWRGQAADIRSIPLQTPSGTLVPLGEVAVLKRGESPTQVFREGQTRMVTVTGQIAGRDLASVMRDVTAAVEQVELPEGVLLEFGGQNQEMNESFGQLFQALLLGIVLVFMIMASQFESVLQPLAIMFTLPLALIGVVLGLLLGGSSLSVPGIVGVIMLAGIVVNNAIVLIDYINTLRRRGMERNEAIAQAGRTRLRPILMTTLTTILGMLPLAIGVGEGSEMQRPIALVVIGGLTSSTMLTLIVIPVAYSLVDGLKRRFDRWIHRDDSAAEGGTEAFQG